MAFALIPYVVRSNRSAARPLPELGSPRWAALQTGLPASLQDDPALVRYTRRARRWRIAGVLAGWWGLPLLWVVVTERPLPVTAMGGLEYVIAGWFAGGLVHDLFVRNRTSAVVRVAQLTTRPPLRYVTTTARRWLLASYALSGAAAILAIVAGDGMSWRRSALAAAGTLAVLAIGAVAVWRIAARPHPAADPA
ncbi:MAG: hypothetical protein ACRDZ2_15615, partial [Ilumatobacteraceae bacterium]